MRRIQLILSFTLKELWLRYFEHDHDGTFARVLTDADIMTYPQDILNSPSCSEHHFRIPLINSDIHDIHSRPLSSNGVPRSPSPPIDFKALRHLVNKHLPKEPWPYDDQDDTVYSGSYNPDADVLESNIPKIYRKFHGSKGTQQDLNTPINASPLEHERSLFHTTFETALKPTSFRDEISHESPDKNDLGSLSPVDLALRDMKITHNDPDNLASYASESFVLGSDSTLGNNEPDIPLLSSSSFVHAPNVMPPGAAVQTESSQDAPQGVKMDDHAREITNFPRPIAFSESSHPNGRTSRRGLNLDNDLVFRRVSLSPPASGPSLLQLSLQHADSSNEDMEFAKYTRIGRNDHDHGFRVLLYYPGQVDPQTKALVSPIQVWVQPEASMEELIGYGVYSYVKKFGRAPTHPKEEKAEALISPRSWMLRMVENGIIDDDFPVIDYGLIVGHFGEHEFALCPVTSGSKQSDMLDSTIGVENVADVPKSLNTKPSAFMMLHIMVVPMANSQIQVQISPDATIGNVLEQVCHDCNLGPMDLYALLCQKTAEILSPNEVASKLECTSHNLVLVERTSLGRAFVPARDTHAQAVLEEPKYKTAMDMISSYKAYSVSRRHHIAMGRHERVISLDGEWLHIIRPAEKRVSHAKTTSYLLSSIIQCELNPRLPQVFRIVAHRVHTHDTKRYEFEAEDAVRAQEIVNEINQQRRQ